MWMLFVRAQPPDRRYWSGRRGLAAGDAVVWPVLWLLAIRLAPVDLGVVGALACAWTVVAAMQRLRVAVWNNHRYHFTTWRWAKVLAGLLIVATFLKLTS